MGEIFYNIWFADQNNTMSGNANLLPACWPKWCEIHQRERVVWCITCQDAVCRLCAVGTSGGQCGGHETTIGTEDGPDKEGLATQIPIPPAMVGFMGAEDKTNLRNKILADFPTKPMWRACRGGGAAVLQGARKDARKAFLAFRDEMKPRTMKEIRQQDRGRGRGRGTKSQGARGSGGQGAGLGASQLPSEDVRETRALQPEPEPELEDAGLQMAKAYLELGVLEPGQLLEVVGDLRGLVNLD